MKKILQLLSLSILTSLLFVVGCKKEEPVPATTGTLSGTIIDAISGSALADVLVVVFDANTNSPIGASVSSGTDGAYSVELDSGTYFVKASKQGYEKSPPAAVAPISFNITLGVTTTKDIEMFESTVIDGGWISGKVMAGDVAVAGALVVADNAGVGYSTISDEAGNYAIFNVPAATYAVNAWLAGYNSTEVSASVTAATESTGTDIVMTEGAGGSVTGSISFLATGNLEVDVALTHPFTGETIPGLDTVTSNYVYKLTNVPDGTYLARASYNNDGIVMDPDWIVKNGEPRVTVNGGEVGRPFSVTNAVSVVVPTNEATSVEPVVVTTTTPTFEWTPYSATSDYVIEVMDANGKLIWGGFTAEYASKNVVIPGSSTSIAFGDTSVGNAPIEDLVSGKTYRWRIFASKNNQQSATGWELISVSEDQRGLFIVE
ncbi:MAG: carboxypeptidase-like regulatory domain-containing protein [Cyclobacteriaceae bacterium]|nr:carboxypeptidase-like regulatory domain-containing protein [Cyclobacteriaceae bacterium]